MPWLLARFGPRLFHPHYQKSRSNSSAPKPYSDGQPSLPRSRQSLSSSLVCRPVTFRERSTAQLEARCRCDGLSFDGRGLALDPSGKLMLPRNETTRSCQLWQKLTLLPEPADGQYGQDVYSWSLSG